MRYIAVLMSVPLILACTLSQAALSAPLPPATETPAIATPRSTFSPPTATQTPPPAEMPVVGCWNVRSEPTASDDTNILYQICGGTVTIIGWADNGFIQIADGGYICNQAVGENVECR